MIRVTQLLKFDKYDANKWFCLYDSKYIRQYHNETVRKDLIVPMKRYLDEMYSQELVNNVIERYDARGYMYADLMSQALFTAQLKLIKTK